MVERAIADIPQFSLLNTEINRQGVSFTIDTVRALLKQYPDIELHLLLGGDHLDHFHEWKEADQLIALAPPLVGMRKQHSLLNAPLVPELLKGKVEIPLFDISSTEVRKRLIQKKYCSHLVPPLVLDYIAEHSLYSSVHEKQ
jgi:nicotinate-nucleotide adenylyltransferase